MLILDKSFLKCEGEGVKLIPPQKKLPSKSPALLRLRMQNFHLYINTSIKWDFQIWIKVPLSKSQYAVKSTKKLIDMIKKERILSVCKMISWFSLHRHIKQKSITIIRCYCLFLVTRNKEKIELEQPETELKMIIKRKRHNLCSNWQIVFIKLWGMLINSDTFWLLRDLNY